MSQEPLLKVSNLSVHFGSGASTVRAVDGASFSVMPGETFALLGESGSGKSITALSIMRLVPEPGGRIVSGSIELGKEDYLRLSEKEMRSRRGSVMSMIFQEPMTSLNPVLSIGQQLAETLCTHQALKTSQALERSIELLDEVGIADPEKRVLEYPHQLSGGMKQRVMIAMALAAEPELLIADEPTTALDVTIQAQVLSLLRELQERKGTSILLITHDLGVVSEVADTIGVMYQGKVIEIASRSEFFSGPKHEYSQELLSAAPACRASILGDEQDGSITTNETKVLDVQELKVHFPIKKGLFKKTVGHVKAVDGVSFDLRRGETLALVGESGCGKTTLAMSALQLVQSSEGSVDYEGRKLSELSSKELLPLRSDLQLVFQDPYTSMNPRMTVFEILEEGMVAQKLIGNRDQRRARAAELLKDVELKPDMLDRYPNEFSGGQRQRICIARALSVDPQVIVCDEPTSALDVSVQAQILGLLRELQVKRALSYLLITHDISVVEYLAHRVAVMYLGKIVEEGPVSEVLGSPSHPYTKALLSATPRISEHKPEPKELLGGEIPSPINPPKGCHFHPRCPIAEAKCSESYPEFVAIGEKRRSACYFPSS